MTWGCGGRPPNSSAKGTSYDLSLKQEALCSSRFARSTFKKQNTRGQGEIYQPCKDNVWNCYKPSSATKVVAFFQLHKEILCSTLHGEEDDQVLSFGREDNLIWASRRFFSLIRFIDNFVFQLSLAKLWFGGGE